MSAFLRGNIGLLVWVAIFTLTTIVLTFAAILMNARGLSLKPIWWFAGFMLLIGFPQLVYHAFVAVSSVRSSAPAPGAGSPASTRVENPEALFDVVPEGAAVRDIPPQSASGVMGRADKGRLLSMANGDTLMVLQFASATDAETAVGEYLQESGLKGSAQPDGPGGFVIAGNDQRLARVYARGNVFVMHTTRSTPPGNAVGPPGTASVDPMKRLTASTSGKLVAGVLFLYILFVAGYYLKGLAWATRVDAAPVARVLSASELRERLLALNNLDIPFYIEPGRDGELTAIWKYADAKWVDLARARGVRRIHRIQLSVDEASRKIRATDFQSSYDWSAGVGGGSFAWKATTGVVLFQYEQQRVYGLRVDSQGRAAPEFSYAYTFDLQEMKAPLVETVTRAGWRWQPVAWQAPSWLRGVTE